MPTVLITGAGRGLGLEFARQYAADGWRVVATVRDDAAAARLDGIADRVERLDVADLGTVDAFAESVGNEAFEVVILNAGVYGPREPEADGWLNTFAVNTIAPTLLGRALAPLVAPGGTMVAITSKMGSIADNTSGGMIAYRSSKAALNAAWKSLALDLRGKPLTVAVLHPGWVQTDMGGASAPTTPEESIAGLRRVIEDLEPRQSGAFLDFQGKSIPW